VSPAGWGRRTNTTHPTTLQSSSPPLSMWKGPARIHIATRPSSLGSAYSNATARKGGFTKSSAPGSGLKTLAFRDAAIEKKDLLKARGYSWSPGESGRPRCWYRDVSDADKAAEVSWLRQSVMGPDQAVWALRITARDRYSDRCWGWGVPSLPLGTISIANRSP
jgi:hypothetical protein